MKKWLVIEIIIFLALIILAVVVCSGISQGAFAPDTADTTLTTAETTVETTAETTEPEPTWMSFPANRQLTAQQYFVYDCASDSFTTLSGSQDERVYPASITKLFTAYVALQYVEPTALITAGDVLDLVVWGSSVAEIEKGDVLTAEMLVEAMLLPSGNDAAYLLAAEAGRSIAGNPELPVAEAVSSFMDEMNRQAQALGMTGTHFVNPDGIHEDAHYSTFADLALLGQLSKDNDTIMKYANVSRADVTFESGTKKQWKNTNALIDPTSQYYCPYAVGLKTGQTPSAGSCLLSAFSWEGRDYIIGVFGCPEIEDRFADTLQLFNQTIGR